MTCETDVARVVDLRSRALAHLDAHGIAATPENYAFWFAYAEGRCPELNRAVDGLIAQGRPVTVDGLADAYARFSASAAAGEPSRRHDHEVSNGLDTLLQLLSEMTGNVREFGASLQMADRKLAGDRTGLDVQALTGLLLEACRRSLLRNAQIEQQLEVSRRKVAVLQEEVVSLGREATTDALTGLRNRRAFDNDLAKLVDDARRQGEPLSLILGISTGSKGSTTRMGINSAIRC
jgi:diguanylate cyclase